MLNGLKKHRLTRVVNDKAAAHLRAFRRDAERALPGKIVGVILFGSRARGEARRDSDYDVAVFIQGLDDRHISWRAFIFGRWPCRPALSHSPAGAHSRWTSFVMGASCDEGAGQESPSPEEEARELAAPRPVVPLSDLDRQTRAQQVRKGDDPFGGGRAHGRMGPCAKRLRPFRILRDEPLRHSCDSRLGRSRQASRRPAKSRAHHPTLRNAGGFRTGLFRYFRNGSQSSANG